MQNILLKDAYEMLKNGNNCLPCLSNRKDQERKLLLGKSKKRHCLNIEEKFVYVDQKINVWPFFTVANII